MKIITKSTMIRLVRPLGYTSKKYRQLKKIIKKEIVTSSGQSFKFVKG